MTNIRCAALKLIRTYCGASFFPMRTSDKDDLDANKAIQKSEVVESIHSLSLFDQDRSPGVLELKPVGICRVTS